MVVNIVLRSNNVVLKSNNLVISLFILMSFSIKLQNKDHDKTSLTGHLKKANYVQLSFKLALVIILVVNSFIRY